MVAEWDEERMSGGYQVLRPDTCSELMQLGCVECKLPRLFAAILRSVRVCEQSEGGGTWGGIELCVAAAVTTQLRQLDIVISPSTDSCTES